IDNYWPLLLHFGINKYHDIGLEFLKDVKDKIEVKEEIFVEYNPSESVVERQKGRFYLQPSDEKAFASKNYEFIISNDREQSRLGLKSTYSNENGRGRIKVIMKGNGFYKEYDVLDMNKEILLDISEGPILINITYDKDYKNTSWQSAARLYCAFK